MEGHQATTVKVELEELDFFEFVEVPQDVHQLCTACLCATRTTHTLSDGALKQYYMHILTEMQPEGVVLQSPRVCWECVTQLKRSVRFREQVQDSYRLLQTMLSITDKVEQAEFLQSSVCRPERLNTCLAHSINISPQDDMQAMTAAKHDHDNLCHNNKTVPSPYCKDGALVLCSDDRCSECPNKQRQHNMKTNIQYVSKVRYQCKVCHTSFPSKGHLLAHKRTHGEKPYQCEVCHKSFTKKSDLIRHKRIHTGDKPFQCEVCDKSFAKKSDLIRHQRTHTGEKPFQCEVCQKSFADLTNLITHNRTHTGEKPFQCKVCHKSYAQKGHLNEHSILHTGERPYQCNVCDKAFTRKAYLIKHLRTLSCKSMLNNTF